MRLVIQIPCCKEREALPVTLPALPRKVGGFDAVEWLAIDDGSTSGAAEVARAHLLAINRRLLEELRYLERLRRSGQTALRQPQGASADG